MGGLSNAGAALKSQYGWTSEGNGTDAVGFYALPVGSFTDPHGYGVVYWTATEKDESAAYAVHLRYNKVNATLTSYDKSFDSYPEYGYYVRCVKD